MFKVNALCSLNKVLYYILANSVLCVKCGKWIHGRSAKVKRVTSRLGRDFVCGRCKKQADGLAEPVEEFVKRWKR